MGGELHSNTIDPMFSELAAFDAYRLARSVASGKQQGGWRCQPCDGSVSTWSYASLEQCTPRPFIYCQAQPCLIIGTDTFGRWFPRYRRIYGLACNILQVVLSSHGRPGLQVWPLVASDVLVETFEEGQLISNYVNHPGNVRSAALANLGLNAYLKMLLRDNFLHADLHPGRSSAQCLQIHS